jgi:ABC-type transport system involved in multi-copper enzyme maturation permease subunit
MSSLRPLVAYLLRSACADRLLAVLALAIVAGAALAGFLGSTALVEQSELAMVYAATAGRHAVVAALVLFTCFHLRRAFESREVDLLLSRPVSRFGFVLAEVATLVLLAGVGAVLAGIAVAASGRPEPAALGLWTSSLMVEAAIAATAALFFALALTSGVAAALAGLGFYVLSRMIGLLGELAGAQGGSGPQGWLADQAVFLLGLALPRLDLFARTSWLVHGGGEDAAGLGLIFAQGLVYLVLLTAAAGIDFERRAL